MAENPLAGRLRFGSRPHDDLSQKLKERLDLSRNTLTSRYSEFDKLDEQFCAYMPERELDIKRKELRDQGLPQYTTVVVPYSYAILMTAHTYLTSVFLSRSPIMQFMGRHGETENQILGVEAVMDYQLRVGQWLVPLYIWLLDPMKYGFGVVGHYWEKEIIRARKFEEQPVTFLGIPMPGKTKKVEMVADTVGYEGNRLFNVRPKDFYPDPRVSMWKFQTGEFVCRYCEIPIHEFEQGVETGRYFNEKAAIEDSKGLQRAWERGGSNTTETLPGEETAFSTLPPGVIKGYEICVRLNPKEWGLADTSMREIWVFNVTASSNIVFGAEPLGELSNRFPYDIVEVEPHGYNLFSRSWLDIFQPLQDTMTWLFNTHFYNVRASLNNQFVVDPQMVNMDDLRDPAPGKLIRLKPGGINRDVRAAIAQLPVADITKSHINDGLLVEELVQKISGVNDNIMGMVNAGGRKTATEVRASNTLGANRLKTLSEFYSAMGFEPLAQKALQRTQQNLTEARRYRIIGDLAMYEQDKTMEVTPESIAGFFDFVPVDGTLPVDRYAQANLWQTIMGQMAQIPQLAAGYDLVKIFGWVGNLAGLKNINRFRVQVAPPGTDLAGQAQAGNVVPLRGEPGQPPNQIQLQGMGPTG
jgi:hypothetical protein